MFWAKIYSRFPKLSLDQAGESSFMFLFCVFLKDMKPFYVKDVYVTKHGT